MPLACPIQSGVALRLATALQICWTPKFVGLKTCHGCSIGSLAVAGAFGLTCISGEAESM
jgi:hypothetical protein